MRDLLNELLAPVPGLAAFALEEAVRTYVPPPENPLEDLLRSKAVMELLAVYRVAIGDYTDRKLALRHRYLANSDVPFRPRRGDYHLGFGIESYGGMTLQFYKAEENKTRIRRQLLELGVPMFVLRQVHRGER